MGLHFVGLGNAGNSCCYRDALFSRNNGIRLCRSANTGHYSALRLCAGYAYTIPVSMSILPYPFPSTPSFQTQSHFLCLPGFNFSPA
jgi:hypothetical protein